MNITCHGICNSTVSLPQTSKQPEVLQICAGKRAYETPSAFVCYSPDTALLLCGQERLCKAVVPLVVYP